VNATKSGVFCLEMSVSIQAISFWVVAFDFAIHFLRLILQYILYSKNEKKSRLDFYCGKTLHSKRAILPASTKNRPILIENREKYYVAKSNRDNPKGKRCKCHTLTPAL
jgi:hypothetical protein